MEQEIAAISATDGALGVQSYWNGNRLITVILLRGEIIT